MKTMKKTLTGMTLAATLAVNAVSPAKEANAGVLIAAAGATFAALPVAVAVGAMFGGFGTSVASIYYAIAHRDKSWICYGFFMLDADMADQSKVESLVSQRYPGLDQALVAEIATLVSEKAKSIEFDANNIKDVVLSEAELSSVLNVLDATNPELGKLIKEDLTQSTIK